MDDVTTTMNPREFSSDAPQGGSGASYPLVTVTVVAHNPGAWFDEVLDSIVGQDYQNLDVLVVDAASDDPLADRVHATIPEATVVPLVANQGFAKNANTVLDHHSIGPYVLICHDDVAMAPDCVRRLIEEALRSNAGIVGPKLLHWTDPNRILHVGLGADKTGLVSDLAEPGEYDQEQHDAVRDVFAVPGAVTLIRTDLFHALGGFDPEMLVRGEDLDLCWRAHALGARVLVNPAATARHREDLTTRITGQDYNQSARRHRIRSLLSNYGLAHTIRVVPQAIAASLINMMLALFQGRIGDLVDIAAAWGWNLARIGSVMRRRRHLARIRQVSDAEVRALQIPGFEGINSWRRARSDRLEQERVGDEGEAVVTIGDRSRELQLTAAIWIGIVAILLIGSRELIVSGLPVFGEFASFPNGPSSLLSEWSTTWRSAGMGSEGPASMLHLLLGFAGVALFGQVGILRLLVTLGLIAVGVVGAHRLLAPFGSLQGSLVAALVYAAAPLPYNALYEGSWGALALYAALPWMARRLATAAGVPPFGDRDDRPARRLADIAQLALVAAVAATVEPLALFLPLVLATCWTVGSLATRRVVGFWRLLVVSSLATAFSFGLAWPVAIDVLSAGEWSAFNGVDLTRTDPIGLSGSLRLATGPHGDGAFGWPLLVLPVVALVVASGQRLAWAARSWFVAIAAVAVVVLGESGILAFVPAERAVLLAPAALGFSMAAGTASVAFGRDLVRYGFGWRQLVPFVAIGALVLTSVAGIGAAFGGRWGVVDDGYDEILAFLDETAPAHARVLWSGDEAVLPVPGWTDGDGEYFSMTHARTPTVLDHGFGRADPAAVEAYRTFKTSLGSGSNRLGARLAPYGIRYVLVVESNAPEPFGTISVPADGELLTRLSEQLDLVRVRVRSGVTVYENRSWIPIVSSFEPGTLDSLGPSRLSGAPYELALAEVTSMRTYSGPLAASDLFVALDPDTGWKLNVDGRQVAGREYGSVSHHPSSQYPVVAGGNAVLSYDNGTATWAATAATAIAWVGLAVILVLARRRRT